MILIVMMMIHVIFFDAVVDVGILYLAYDNIVDESVGTCALELTPQELLFLVAQPPELDVDEGSVGTYAGNAMSQESLLSIAPPLDLKKIIFT